MNLLVTLTLSMGITQEINMDHVRLERDDGTPNLTIADALDLLEDKAGFSETDCATIELGSLPLPTSETTYLTCVTFDAASTRFYVTLRAATQFYARNAGGSREIYDITRLDGAIVDYGISGAAVRARLSDGSSLQAVEVIPAIGSFDLTTHDHVVIHALVAYNKAEAKCYRDLLDHVPSELRQGKSLRFLDFSRLGGLTVPALKVLAGVIQDRAAAFAMSEQQISDTLKKCGLRIPKPRRKIGNRTVEPAHLSP